MVEGTHRYLADGKGVRASVVEDFRMDRTVVFLYRKSYVTGPCAFLLVTICLAAAGCAGDGRATRQFIECRERVDKLEAENTRLTRELVDARQTVKNQAQQIQTLQKLGSQRLDEMNKVRSVELDRLTGGYDDNKDKYDDGIVMYLQPKDDQDQIFKASGSVRVRLFELQGEKPRIVGECHYAPKELSKTWMGRFWTQHFTVKCPFSKSLTNPNITAQVDFTELLTGKTFVAEKMVTVKIPPVTQPATMGVTTTRVGG